MYVPKNEGNVKGKMRGSQNCVVLRAVAGWV
jgi:hypothetical protein